MLMFSTTIISSRTTGMKRQLSSLYLEQIGIFRTFENRQNTPVGNIEKIRNTLQDTEDITTTSYLNDLVKNLAVSKFSQELFEFLSTSVKAVRTTFIFSLHFPPAAASQ